MTKVSNNPLLKGLSGMLGDVIVYRETRGKMVMANKPKKSRRKPTELQANVRDKFREGVQYAKAMVAIPEMKAVYQTAVGTGERASSAYAAALNDYLRSPEVKHVDLARYNGTVGGVIVIKAVDDFRVESVAVSIIGADGAVMESGDAVAVQYSSNLLWSYTATVVNASLVGTKIRITVKDKATNTTVSETVIS